MCPSLCLELTAVSPRVMIIGCCSCGQRSSAGRGELAIADLRACLLLQASQGQEAHQREDCHSSCAARTPPDVRPLCSTTGQDLAQQICLSSWTPQWASYPGVTGAQNLYSTGLQVSGSLYN